MYPKLNELTATEMREIIKKNEFQWQFAEMGTGIGFCRQGKEIGFKYNTKRKQDGINDNFPANLI